MPEIKLLAKKDLKAFANIAADAYPGIGFHSPEEKKNLLKILEKRFDFSSNAAYHGYYKNKELLGGLALYDFEMNLFGNKVLCGGGGFLAVSLLHKKENIARDLCRYFFRYYRTKDAPVAALYSFSPRFYRKMGVGYGSKGYIYRFAPESLPYNGDKKYLRELTSRDKTKMIKCFNEFADQNHGMFYDYPDYRNNFYNRNKKSRFIGYIKNNKLEGYLVYRFKPKSGDNFIDNELEVVEFVYLNKDAYLSICSYLHSQKDQIRIISYLNFDDNFHFNLKEPRNDSGNFYPSVFHETNTSALGIMYRLLNPKKIFTLLSEHDFNGESLRLRLNIEDTFLKENDSKFVVYFEDGYPTLMKSTSPVDVEMKIGIADFSSLLLGAIDFNSLYRYGGIKISKDKYINQLNSLFMTDNRPFCMTDF
jgi:predicted acetyltransferase